MTMGDSGHRENGRHKADQYNSVHSQWMIPQQHMKDTQAITVMALTAERNTAIAERDAVIQEHNITLSEKKAALAERDMAILQRDAAIAERNAAFMERDNAIAALEYARANGISASCWPGCPLGCNAHRGAKRIDDLHHVQPEPPQLANDSYDNLREISTAKAKRARNNSKDQEIESQSTPTMKKASRSKKGKMGDGGDITTFKKQLDDGGEGIGGSGTKHHDELGVNRVEFDESTMPVPVCSCTGKYRQCYKWGDGGWQSACCTPLLSMYPLPLMPEKRHARVGGRKMSGSAFTKLLSRLAAEGRDLSAPVDLKDHWARHGTNRFITIK